MLICLSLSTENLKCLPQSRCSGELLSGRLNGHPKERDGPSPLPYGLRHPRQLEGKEETGEKQKAEGIPGMIQFSVEHEPARARHHAMS